MAENKKYLSEKEEESKDSKRGFSFLPIFFYVVGIIVIIGGVYQGMRLLSEARVLNDPYIRYIAMAFTGGGPIIGISLIAFGRNIALLRDIRNKLD